MLRRNLAFRFRAVRSWSTSNDVLESQSTAVVNFHFDNDVNEVISLVQRTAEHIYGLLKGVWAHNLQY